jgi:hypothetical protein
MDEEFGIDCGSWAEKYLSARKVGVVEKAVEKMEVVEIPWIQDIDGTAISCRGSKLLSKKDSWGDGIDSPQFSPTPPPTSPTMWRVSIMLTHSMSWDDRTEAPMVTPLPSWGDVREQFNYAQEVGMFSGLCELAIREKERFLAEWTMHSLAVARPNGPY